MPRALNNAGEYMAFSFLSCFAFKRISVSVLYAVMLQRSACGYYLSSDPPASCLLLMFRYNSLVCGNSIIKIDEVHLCSD